MKPLKLVMSAFGSYAGEEIIDFRQVKRGVFLITGDTGAGKTTIFDAITYALYDQTSGGRRDGSMMRSQFAGPETPTFVEYSFSYQGEEYKIRRNPSYSRISKRKNKDGEVTFTTEGASVSLTMPDGQEYPGRVREVNEKIVEILGVGREQFTQIAMIAQGEFIRLLHASSRERKEIFANIFDTGIYGKLQMRLREKSKELYGRLEDNRKLCVHEIQGVCYNQNSQWKIQWEECREQIETHGKQILACLSQILEEQHSQEREFKQQEGLLNKQQEEQRFQMRQAHEINNLFAKEKEAKAKMIQTKKLLENLKKEEEQSTENLEDLEKQCLEQIPVLTEQLVHWKSLLPRYVHQKEQEELVRQAVKQKQSLEKQWESQSEQIAQLEAFIAELEENVVHLSKEVEGLPTLLQKEKEMRQQRTLLEEMTEAAKRWTTREAERKNGQERLQALLLDYQKKSQQHDRKYRIFIEEQAGFLAQDLEEGKPCPVCGSVAHPQKAQLSTEAVTRQQVEHAKSARDKADQNLQEYREQFQKLQEECEQQRALIYQDGQRLFGEEFEIKMLLPALKDSEKQVRELENRRKELENKAIRLKEEKETLEKSRNSLATRKVQLEELKEKRYEAELSFQTAEQARRSLQEELPCKTEEEVQERIAQASEKKRCLEQERVKADAYLKKLREEIAKNHGIWMEQVQNQEYLTTQLQGKEPVESRVLEEQAEQLEQKAKKLEMEKRSITSRIDRNREAEKHLTTIFQERDKLKLQYKLVGNLDRTANGTLAQHVRMDLQTYVQRRYFKYMIREANRRLVKMNGEQFILQCRELQNLGRQGEVGLDLDVYDLVTDKVRDVKTLSGGEAFLAALAMALGMADVIQKTAGKVHLETMFIDEGFGSLDEEARRRAIGILNELAKDIRLVGIISHVAELREQMERKLVIRKGTQGSHAAWVLE
ncbi:MAG: SMC family ATPase [Lachnospiraceae bacterium]|nr:SMC family ATPase [Lachnospiraceae bacterium]